MTNYDAILSKVDTINPVKYAHSRNYINGHVNYLSPYISRGVISAKQSKAKQTPNETKSIHNFPCLCYYFLLCFLLTNFKL